MGLILNYLRKRRVVVREVLYGHPYLKYLIDFWPGGGVKQMENIKEMGGMNNFLVSGGNKWLRLVHHFARQ